MARPSPTKRRTKPPAAEGPARQVAGFIAKFDPAIGALARAARAAVRRRFPTAVEQVYDNYNALAMGFGPNERTSEIIVSVAVFPRGVSLYFMHGARLPDPQKVLKGSGNQGRFIRLESGEELDDPGVEALLQAAIRLGKTPLPATRRGHTVVKSISTRQRPRRPISK